MLAMHLLEKSHGETRMKPDVYEGNEPYIFVSYAHRDSVAVFEVLAELQERGYRLWYDDGIAPGSEWPEDIAQHLDAAAMVMAFVTPNSMESQNCRREINFSLARNKPFLSILLEKTDMPLGMQMQLSAQQSIVRYNYDSWDGFIKKVLSCPDIEPCKAEPEPAPAPQSMPEPTPAPTPAPAAKPEPAPVQTPPTAMKSAVTPEIVSAETQNAPTRASTAARESILTVAAQEEKSLSHEEKKALSESKPAESSANKRSKGTPKVAGIVAAAVVAVLVLVFAFGGSGSGGFTTSWGSNVNSDATSVLAAGKTVTQDDLQQIASVPSLTRLSFTNCDLSNCDFSQVAFASDALNYIDLSGSTGIDDFSFLSKLSLRSLNVSGHEAFHDLSILDTSRLETLYAAGTGIGNLSPLEGAPLHELDVSSTLVGDITALANASMLEEVAAAHTGVTSVDSILALENLTSIDFSGCKISWPDRPLAALKLKKAYLADTGLTNLAILSDCSVLKDLDVSDNEAIDDFSALDTQNYETLTRLDIARTSASADNLAWIAKCKNLEELNLDGIALGDLSFCKSLENLESIYAAGCSLGDISALSQCTKLVRVYLACNEISDISAFPALAEISRDTVIDLSYNQLKDVSSLPVGEYRAILLYGNADDISLSIPQDIAAYDVVVPWCSAIGESALTARGNFTTIYLLDCPKKQEVKATSLLGAHAKLIDENALLDMYRNDGFDYGLDYDATQLLTIKG